MGLYEGIKDVAKVVQQADNIELYRQLVDLSAQALEMQNEINRLTAENTELRKKDPVLTDEIRKLMFVFEDIAGLDAMDIQTLSNSINRTR